MSLEESLDKLGLTKYEAQAFTYIVQNGSVEAGEITGDTNIPNGKIYETLNKLEFYGFIEIQQSRPKRYRSRNINIAIEEYLERKKELLDLEFKKLEDLGTKAIQQFEQIHLEESPKKEEIFWRTAFGPEINELYYTSMKEAKHSILYFIPHSIHDRSMSKLTFKSHAHENKDEFNQEKDLIAQLLSQGQKDKITRILFAGEYECPFFKDLFSLLLDKEPAIEIRALQQDIITPPIILIDDIITIMDIVDPIDNHTTMGITKIWDSRLNKKLKEKIETLWEQGLAYRKVFPKIRK